MKTACGFAVWMLFAAATSSLVAADAEKYTLRYKFQSGETVRWEVEHRSKVRATVSGSTQNTESATDSVKVWHVTDVQPDGAATFQHSVESVDMRLNLADCKDVHYNSQTDAKPPAGYEDVQKRVGVVLSTVTIDPRGKVLHRQDSKSRSAAPKDVAVQDDGWMTIPLPDEAVSVGHAWSLPLDIEIPVEGGGVKKVKAVQQFTLEEVKTGVATIRVSTDILSPVTDPTVEVQLVQRETAGRVRFDVDAGRIIGQQMDIDKHVVGFRGEASSIHYLTRFSERLLADEVKTAEKTGGQAVEK